MYMHTSCFVGTAVSRGIGLDTMEQHLYYTNIHEHDVKRMNYNGENDEVICSNCCENPRALALDTERRYIEDLG